MGQRCFTGNMFDAKRDKLTYRQDGEKGNHDEKTQ